MSDNQDQLELLKNLIKEWGISLPVLAKNMGMSLSTFKNKFYRSGGKYDFTSEEIILLSNGLRNFGEKLRREAHYAYTQASK